MSEILSAPSAVKRKTAAAFENFREAWQRQVIADHRALTPGAVYTAIAISWHMNRNKSGLAWPGVHTLARLIKVERKTVMRATTALENRGHLTAHRNRKGRVNQYQPLLKARPGMGLPSPKAMGPSSPKAMGPGTS